MPLPIIETDTFVKNSERSGNKADHEPCVRCGKGIRRGTARYSVHVFYGNTIVTEDEAREIIAREGEGGDMYFYPLGSDCYRAWKKDEPTLDQYVHRS